MPGVTSLSVSASGSMIAIGTMQAVFYCKLEPGGLLGECSHQLVSAVIDDIPTALALTPSTDYLYIGNSMSASAWDLGSAKSIAFLARKVYQLPT